MSYRAEHQELQGILAKELQEFEPHPLSPKDADAVAWHLADVTMQVVIGAVERERAMRIADATAGLVISEESTAAGHRWWRRIVK